MLTMTEVSWLWDANAGLCGYPFWDELDDVTRNAAIHFAKEVFDVGYADNEEAGIDEGYQQGHEDGYEQGHDDGYDEGYSAGYEDAREELDAESL